MKEIDVFKMAEPITEVLNSFLAPFDCEACMGTEFSYMTASNTITYTLVITEKSDKAFKEFTDSLFPNIKADTFLWSTLHELGHHETEDDFDDDEWEEYMRRTSSEISDEEYFNLPIEFAATAWAGYYIESHTEEVARLWNDLTAAIKKFSDQIELEI